MMSGGAWWTTDVGGFSGGNVNDPYFKELIVRWYQYVMIDNYIEYALTFHRQTANPMTLMGCRTLPARVRLGR